MIERKDCDAAGINALDSSGHENSRMTKTLCGIKCPEDILLVPYCNDDINLQVKKSYEEHKACLLKLHHNDRQEKRSSKREKKFRFDKEGDSLRGLTTSVSETAGCLWSVVVIGRTQKDTSWAPLGYPQGFKQFKISNKFFQCHHSTLNSPELSTPPAPVQHSVAADKCNESLKKRKSITLPVTKKKYLEETESSISSHTNAGVPISRAASSTNIDNLKGNSEDYYEISVVWVDQQRGSVGGAGGDMDILLRAKAVGCPSTGPGGIPSARSSARGGDREEEVVMVKLVEVRVSGNTGCLLSYQVDGVELLSSTSPELSPPSCFQIHRAPTVVDRGGYLTAWRAVGMDKAFVIQPLVSSSLSSFSPEEKPTGANLPPAQISSRPTVGESIMGCTDLRCVQVKRVFMHPPSPGGHGGAREKPGKCDKSLPQSGSGFGQGVQCKWEMVPATVDRGRVLLLLQIQQFVNDSRVRSKVIEVRSNGQEAFVHEIAKTFRLGRESLSPYSAKNVDATQHTLSEHDNEEGMKSKMFLEYVKIRLWKVAFYPSSTIPYVDALSVGPFGGLKYDEADVDDYDDCDDNDSEDNVTPSSQQKKGHRNIFSQAYYDSFDDNVATRPLSSHNSSREKDYSFERNVEGGKDEPLGGKTSLRNLFAVKYCVSYLLDEHAMLLLHAHVDVSALPCPLPRIGLQLKVERDLFSQASWLGLGPHENYPDRKFSCLMAVHSSPIHALGVPYMIPGENGARGGLEWLQLHKGGVQEKKKRSRSRSHASSILSMDCDRSASSSPQLPPCLVTSSTPDSSLKQKPSQDKVASCKEGETICTASSEGRNDDISRQSATGSRGFKSDSGGCGSNDRLPNRELSIRCSRPFSFSALPYSTEQLRNASTTADLMKYQRESSHTSINIDPYVMGIGGDDTWSSCVHDEHILHPSKYDFQLAFSARNIS